MRCAARLLRPAALAFTLLLCVWAGSVGAHTGGTTGFAQVTVKGQTVRYSLTLGLDAIEKVRTDSTSTNQVPLATDYDALAGLVARHTMIASDGNTCTPLPGTVQPPSPERASVVIVILYACAAPVRTLTLRDDLFNVLGRDHHTLASVEWAGGHEQFLLEPDRRETRVVVESSPAQPPTASPLDDGALGFFRLGVEHILEGFDHILFIFALILGGGRFRSLLVIITAFTVAHSITLGLAVLDLVRPPSSIVEPLIALSIAYVAFENIFMERAASRRWLVSLLFGLVHGFGFAGALVELGLPDQALFSSLLFFNLGVEAGQALIVAVLFPALLWMARFPWKQRAVTSISAVVLLAAIALLAERALWG